MIDPTNKDKSVLKFTYDLPPPVPKECRPSFTSDGQTDGSIGPCKGFKDWDSGCNMNGVEWDPWKEGWERTFECHFDALERVAGT